MTGHLTKGIAVRISTRQTSLSEEIECFLHWKRCQKCRDILWQSRKIAGFTIDSKISSSRAFVITGSRNQVFQAICTDRQVLSVSLIENDFEYIKRVIENKGVKIYDSEIPETAQHLSDGLENYFARGTPLRYTEVSTTLFPSYFCLNVLYWTWLIPFGKVVTYGDIAVWLKKPAAARAVGGALKRNPIPIIIPCHRVIGSGGNLTGFAGGLDLKRHLLEIEGSASPAIF